MRFASSGNGSSSHLASVEVLKSMAGLQYLRVPCTMAAARPVADMLGKRVDVTMLPISPGACPISATIWLRALGQTGSKRSADRAGRSHAGGGGRRGAIR